ncbi:MAG: SpoIIE family protein phosphatase [Candidatus Eremiobacteraeota bacterium]|nr:SpoIIE family protein phosphatase [Candidatus Eremiobacteraeota bacterium]
MIAGPSSPAANSGVPAGAVPLPKVAVLMNNKVNVRLIAAALNDECDIVAATEESGAIEGADLMIVDESSLKRFGPAIYQARAQQHPFYLPVVLLTEGGDAGLPDDIRSIVDDVLRRPVSRAELRIRLKSLLRIRFLSREVVRMHGLYETERAVAQRFQIAAMTKALPEMPGVVLHGFYCAGRQNALIGGDWYDALALDDGRLVMSIGDVCGSGLDAAVLMAQVRQVIRGVAHIHPDPQMMLDAANRNLHAEYPDAIVTALAAVLDPVTSTLEYANAGHVPALLRDRRGNIHTLEIGDLPLGVGLDPPRLYSISMPPGSSLLFYTDGLTEFDRDILGAQHRLEDAFRAERFDRGENPARTVFAAMLPGPPPDDVAILLVRYVDSQETTPWSFRSEDPEAFAKVRSKIRARLDTLGFAESQTTAELIFAELVGNVVRYAPGTVDVFLDTRNGKAVLHVLDRGPSFSYTPRLPSNLLSENGRGLFLVKELSHDFNVSPRPDGGSHARVVLK